MGLSWLPYCPESIENVYLSCHCDFRKQPKIAHTRSSACNGKRHTAVCSQFDFPSNDMQPQHSQMFDHAWQRHSRRKTSRTASESSKKNRLSVFEAREWIMGRINGHMCFIMSLKVNINHIFWWHFIQQAFSKEESYTHKSLSFRKRLISILWMVYFQLSHIFSLHSVLR